MVKKYLPLLTALLAGAVGFGLRRWQLSAGFEEDTALAIPGAPSAIALVAFSLAVTLLLLLLCRRGEKVLTWDVAFQGGRQSTLLAVMLLLSGFLLLGSGALELLHFSESAAQAYAGETQIARVASAVLLRLRILLCLGALPAVFLWTRAIFRGEGGSESLACLVPCLLYCVWLISDYQLRSADPVVMDYVYEVFAIVTALLGLYYIAGHAFGNGRPRRALLFCLLGTYFSLVTLADAHFAADSLRYLFAALYLTAHAVMLLPGPTGGKRLIKPNQEAQDHG